MTGREGQGGGCENREIDAFFAGHCDAIFPDPGTKLLLPAHLWQNSFRFSPEGVRSCISFGRTLLVNVISSPVFRTG